MDINQELAALLERLQAAAGDNLVSVLLYGSAARDRHDRYSDLNVLCVLQGLDAAALDQLRPAFEWWSGRAHSAPALFASAELPRSADVFAIEFLDIQAHRRVLFGPDPFADLKIPLDLHRVQLEHELRAKLARLRQGFLVARRDRDRLQLLLDSMSSMLTLFRHALFALDGSVLHDRNAVLDAVAARFSADVTAFRALLDFRRERRRRGDLDIPALASSYLDCVTRVTSEVDRLLDANGQRPSTNDKVSS
ncbi:MAG: hypothetical protein ACR2IF_12475 [Terriglobales bacterium]